MTKSTLRRLVVATAVFASLVHGEGTGLAAPKPPTFPPVPLVVTVEDFDSDGRECRICVDDPELGPYQNGFEGVTANLDAYGNVIINFNAAQTPTVRKLRFDYTDPVDPGNTFRPPAALNSYLSTQTHPAGPIQNMTIGTAQCIQSNITFTDVDTRRTMYRNNYRRALGSFDVSQTSYLVVTRINADVWELEPKTSSCNPTNETVAKLFSNATHGNGAVTDRGLYRLPFKMTLFRQ